MHINNICCIIKNNFIDALGIPFLSALNQICIHKYCIGKTMTKQRVDFHEAYSGLLLSSYVVDKGAKKIKTIFVA